MTDTPPHKLPGDRPADDLPIDLQRTQVSGEPFDDFEPTVSIEGYTAFEEIHRGGQGIVFRARQESTKRTVAIKVLREGAHAGAAARKRFQREVEIVARLDHPNIVSIFDSGVTAQHHPYFVMEYVHGQELDQHVRGKHLSLEDTLRLFQVILEAVHHAHVKGVVHRDLKPSNILVDSLGNPKLVDFGLARAERGSDSVASLTGQVLGTVAYMSPEQVLAKPDDIGPGTDVYSLGVILYEILTGKSPYPAATQLVDILRHIAETPPRRPSRSWDSQVGIVQRSAKQRAGKCPIDGEMETILLKAMAKEPARRYASAHAFAADIGRYLEGRPIEARRDSGLYVIRKKMRRNRRALVTVTVAVAVVAAMLAVSVRFWMAAPQRLDPDTLARFEAAEQEYVRTRDELTATLQSRAAAAGGELNEVTRQSLEIIQQAIVELQNAIHVEPNNVSLRELLMKTYQREIDLLRRMCDLPVDGRG